MLILLLYTQYSPFHNFPFLKVTKAKLYQTPQKPVVVTYLNRCLAAHVSTSLVITLAVFSTSYLPFATPAVLVAAATFTWTLKTQKDQWKQKGAWTLTNWIERWPSEVNVEDILFKKHYSVFLNRKCVFK